MSEPRSFHLYKKAQELMPGGVNSPVRAFEPYPFFTAHAQGSKLYDVDGRAYVDYCMAYGPLILGHAHPSVMEAVKQQLDRGTMYGTPTEIEVDMVELVSRVVPCVEMMRLVNSGTEATMHAIRIARGYTGKDKIIKFEGCYHGAHDGVLVKAGSGASTFGAPTSLGIPQAAAENTMVLPFNNVEVLKQAIEQNRNEIAAIIVEPIIGNAGVILPKEGYLQSIRKITEENEVLLIFDEVITGFRVSLGGAQEYYGVRPDLVTLGKIMGGGFPMAAFGGRKDIMRLVSPLGKVYQAGTLSGNPISVTAGLATLQILSRDHAKVYNQLERVGERLRKALADYVRDAKIAAQVNGIASMFQVFFTDQRVIDYTSAQTSDRALFARFHKELMRRGIFLPPSQFETNFVSTAHTDEDVDKTLEAMDSALGTLRR